MDKKELCKLIQRKEEFRPVPPVKCADGLEMSVQAGRSLYCQPRANSGPWESIEVGFPNQEVPGLMKYAEAAEDPTGTVYGYVPIDVVVAIINDHGGAVD